MELPPLARAWRDQGALEGHCGIEVFVVDRGAGDDAAAAAVFLHGFPSSSLDWRGVMDLLDDCGRLIALDFAGFGFSDKPAGWGYSLIDQADLVVSVLAARGVRRAKLITHDMGTSVACELLARRERGGLPVEIEGVVFINGSVFIEQARLTPSQKLLRSPLARAYTRLASERLFRWQLGRILGRPVADAELEAMWALMNFNGGIERLPETIAYVGERYRFYRRWTGPLARLDIPVGVLWGRQDPVAVAAIGQRLADTIPGARLGARLAWFEDLGHYPQLEDPERVGAEVGRLLFGN